MQLKLKLNVSKAINIFFLMFIIGGVGYAANTWIADTYVNSTSFITNDGDVTMNNTGIFSGNAKSFVRAYDVVVCRNTTAAEYDQLLVECDVVCGDSDCSDEISPYFLNNTNIKFMNGYFPIATTISMVNLNNFAMYGSVNTTLDFISSHIDFNTSNNIKIDDIDIDGTNEGNNGFFIFKATNNIILSNIKTFTNNINSRIFHLNTNCHHVKIDNNQLITQSNSYCIIDASGIDYSLTNNYFENNGTTGLVCFGSLCNSNFVHNKFISNSSAYAGISLEEYADFCETNVSYENIVISDNVVVDTKLFHNIDRELGYALKNIVISNNVVNSSLSPISFNDRADRITISNNILIMNGNYHTIYLLVQEDDDVSITNVKIEDNYIYTKTSNSGILMSNSTNITISGNTFESNDCIYTLGGVEDLTVIGNKGLCRSKFLRLTTSKQVFAEANNIKATTAEYSFTGSTSQYYFDSYNGYEPVIPTCVNGEVFDGKTIHNSTHQATCIDGTWYTTPISSKNSLTGLTWVNTTSTVVTTAYYNIAAARPTAIEGVCYWNTTAGYKCQQCYNSTNWVGLGCVNCNGIAC